MHYPNAFKKEKKGEKRGLENQVLYTSSKWATGGKGLAVGNNTRIITAGRTRSNRALEKRRERKCVESNERATAVLEADTLFRSLSLF